MRRITVQLAVLTAAAVLALPAAAAGPDGTYRGKATGMDGKFRYGKVTVKVKNGKVTYLEIEGVTTTGCGGFMDVVFAPKDPETQIISGGTAIRNGRFRVKYRPVRSIEDQATKITATIRGGRVSGGHFESGGLCVNEGLFKASR